MRGFRNCLLAALLGAALCLPACGPRAVMLNDPSLILTPTSAVTATPRVTHSAEGGGEAYADALTPAHDGALSVSLGDFSGAFNRYAAAHAFPYTLPAELGIGDKRTVTHTFTEGVTLTISLSEGWIVRIELFADDAAPIDFSELCMGGIATLLAADPVLDPRDIDMILTELNLSDDSDDLAATEGSLDYDGLAFFWEITGDGSVIFSVEPAPDTPTPTP